MGFVKMPEMLSTELIKALAGNVYTVKDEPSPIEEMAAACKEYRKEDKKHDKKDDKKEDKKHTPEKSWKDDECCCPKKVKFIFLLNNAVVINVNAVCEEERSPA